MMLQEIQKYSRQDHNNIANLRAQVLQNALRDNREVTDLLKGIDLNSPLPNGQLPLHYAVKKGRLEAVATMVHGGADPMLKDDQGLTAVDHAVYSGDQQILMSLFGKKIVEQFIKADKQSSSKAAGRSLKEIKKATEKNKKEALPPLHRAATQGWNEEFEKLVKRSDLSVKDSDGRTAVHYAAVNPDGKLFGTLLKNGADLFTEDKNGVTPIALLGAAVHERDPLALTKSQSLMFVSLVTLYAIDLGARYGWKKPLPLGVIIGVGVAGATVNIVNYWSQVGHLFNNLDKNWKKVLAVLGILTIDRVPVLRAPMLAWRTYHVGRSALLGLKASWNNFSYRKWKATKNAVVHLTTAGTQSYTAWRQCKMDYELALNGWYMVRIFFAFRDSDEERAFEIYEQYLQFLKKRYHFELPSEEGFVSQAECLVVDPSTIEKMGVIDRLMCEDLEPRCPEHALMMISPQFTMEALKDEGKELFKTPYRQLMLKEVHPDKFHGNADKRQIIEKAAVRLNQAKETLEKWVEENSK